MFTNYHNKPISEETKVDPCTSTLELFKDRSLSINSHAEIAGNQSSAGENIYKKKN